MNMKILKEIRTNRWLDMKINDVDMNRRRTAD